MNTAVLVDDDFPVNQRHFNVVSAHPVDGFVELIDIARELYQKLTDLIWGDVSSVDISSNVEVFGEPIGNRHVDGAFGEGEGEALFHDIVAE